MSLKGNLASVNLTEIFQMLSLSGREGTLFIYEGSRKRAICFTRTGVSIRSRERNESNLLGKILVRLGRVDEAALAHAVEQKRSTSKLLGDILVASGECTKADIEEAFSVQSQEDIQELFLGRNDAQFEYVDGYFPESDAPFVDLNVNQLLIEIARRADEWEYIRHRIRGPREIYRFTGDEGEVDADILSDCYAHRIDGLIDGTRSVGDIIDDSYVNKFHVCKLLSAYLDAEVIEPVPTDAIRQTARLALRMGDAEGAIRHYEYLMSAGDFTLEIMAEAAEAHETNRDFAEAASLLRRLAEEHAREGRDREAIDVLRRIANFPRPEPEALRYLLDLVFAHPRVASEFSAHIIEAGKTMVAHYLRGEQRIDANELLENLIGLFPDEISFAVALVNLYYDEGNVDRAASECERMANSFLKRKRVSPAVSLYKKLLVIDPEREDIREKVRKIVAGKRSRKNGGVLSRALVALAVALLLGGAAVVYIKHEGGIGGTGRSLDADERRDLLARAQDEAGMAGTHARSTMREYARLIELIGGDALTSYEAIKTGLAAAREQHEEFVTRAEAARKVLEALRERSGTEEDDSLVRSMLSALHEQQSNVGAEKAKWRHRAKRIALGMKNQGVARYENGKLLLALARFEMARLLSNDDAWIEETGLDDYIENIRADIERVRIKLEEARAFEAAERWADARRIYIELIRDFQRADLIENIRMPVVIDTVPSGAAIYLDDQPLPVKTPHVIRLACSRETRVVIKRPGYETVSLVLGPFLSDTDPEDYVSSTLLPKLQLWKYRLGGRVESSPVIWNGRVGFIARNGGFAVLEAKTGKVLLKKTIPGGVSFTAGLVAVGDRMYALSLDGFLYTIHVKTGEITRRDLHLADGVYATPVLKDGVLYVAARSGKVLAIDLIRGKSAWSKPGRAAHGVGQGLDLIVQGDDLVVTSEDGTVTVLRCEDGQPSVPAFKVPGPMRRAPVAIDKNDLLFTLNDGTLQLWSRTSGSMREDMDAKGSARQRPVVRGRLVFVSPRDQELIAIDPLTGHTRSHHRPVKGVLRGEVAPTHRMMFAHSETLTAYAGTRDGYAPAWVFHAEGRIIVGPVLVDGGVYIADNKGFVYRLDADDE